MTLFIAIKHISENDVEFADCRVSEGSANPKLNFMKEESTWRLNNGHDLITGH
jgi:hypothetical protein